MNTATSGNEQMLNKVPQLTIYFWIIKIMATTVGETVADMAICCRSPRRTAVSAWERS